MQNVLFATPQAQAADSTKVSLAQQSIRVPKVADETIRWQPFPDCGLFCEVSSPDATLMNGAATLFAPWLCQTPELPPQSAVFGWCVTPVESHGLSQPWRVRGRVNGTYQELVVTDLQSALTAIEYSAAQVLVDYVASEHGCAHTGLFAVHSALLCRDNFGILVVGPSEAGKSTLSCALWQSGWSLCSDDFVFIDCAGLARPIPRRVSLRRTSRALLGESLWTRICNSPSSSPYGEAQLFHPHEVEDHLDDESRERCRPVTIGAIVFLGRRSSTAQSAQLCLQNSAHAALALLPYSTLLPRPPQVHNDETAMSTSPASDRVLDWGAALPKITPLASQVPTYDLGRGPLPEMVAAIETLKEKR